MRILEPGHIFLLSHLDDQEETILSFVKRMGDKYPYNHSARPGTTSQEVTRSLIARTKYVDLQQHWEENTLAIWLLRLVIWLFEFRAHRSRGAIKFFGLRRIEFEPTCPNCLHIRCDKNHG